MLDLIQRRQAMEGEPAETTLAVTEVPTVVTQPQVVPHEQPVVVYQSTVAAPREVTVAPQPQPETEKKMSNEGPSSLAWMLILLLMMGSAGFTILVFLVLAAADIFVPGLTGGSAASTVTPVP